MILVNDNRGTTVRDIKNTDDNREKSLIEKRREIDLMMRQYTSTCIYIEFVRNCSSLKFHSIA